MFSKIKYSIIFLIVIVAACNNQNDIFYIKIVNETNLFTKKQIDIKSRGRIIGKALNCGVEKNHIFFKAILTKHTPVGVNNQAFYRKDILGNEFIELVINDTIDKRPKLTLSDTLTGVYAPLFHEVDSLKKKKIIKVVREIKNALDSLTKNNKPSSP